MPIGINPTVSCATNPSLKFPVRTIAYDPTRRIRFVNIRSIRPVTRTVRGTEIKLRVARGIVNIGRAWKELQWEAVCRAHETNSYSCDAICIVNNEWQWLFTKEHLTHVMRALPPQTALTTVEQLALFIDDCLTSFIKNYAREFAVDMLFTPPKHHDDR